MSESTTSATAPSTSTPTPLDGTTPATTPAQTPAFVASPPKNQQLPDVPAEVQQPSAAPIAQPPVPALPVEATQAPTQSAPNAPAAPQQPVAAPITQPAVPILPAEPAQAQAQAQSAPDTPMAAPQQQQQPATLPRSNSYSLRERKPSQYTFATPRPPTKRKASSTPSSSKRTPKGGEGEGEGATPSDSNKKIKLVVNGGPKETPTHHLQRALFFMRYRSTFEPLLPGRDKAFEPTEKEAKEAGSKGRHFVQYEEIDQQPSLIKGGEMRDFQLVGLSFLAWMYENGMNAILGDEMGLGKTLQTIALLAYLKERHDVSGPHLIVCPLSVLSSWMNEIKRWYPSATAVRLHGSANERAAVKASLQNSNPDIVVCTYESYAAENTYLKLRGGWKYFVLDEGHKIKNAETAISKSTQGFGSQYRLLLTGTPLQNNMFELWSLFHWLYPTLFTAATSAAFSASFDLTKGNVDPAFLSCAQRLLALIMLRRTKDTVAVTVPPRVETTLFVPLSPLARFWYERLLTRMDKTSIRDLFGPGASGAQTGLQTESSGDLSAATPDAGPSTSATPPFAANAEGIDEGIVRALESAQSGTKEAGKWQKLMNLLLQLRRVCDHPYLLAHAEPEPITQGEHIVTASSKLVLLDKILQDLLPKKHKVLIFSQWTKMLDVVEDFLNLRDIKYARLDGSTARPMRTIQIRLFQQNDDFYEVFLLSTSAGGLGINLTAADHVIMLDQHWNPQVDLQAVARAHRIGQTKIVQVYKMVIQDSVEDQMLSRLKKKLYLSLKVMTDSATHQDPNEEGPTMSVKDLRHILRAGAGALSKWGDLEKGETGYEEFMNASAADIITRSQRLEGGKDLLLKQSIDPNAETPEDAFKAAEEEERKLLQGVEQVSTRLFQGRMIPKGGPITNIDIRKEWEKQQQQQNETEKRTRTERIVYVDGHPVLAESMGNKPWEAVKSITSDPKVAASLGNTKREKMVYEHESYCSVCHDGGLLYECTGCPRVCHAECIGVKPKDAARSMFFFCPQHRCGTCDRSAADAGNMLFKCGTCSNCWCEDCLPPGDIESIGPTLPLYRALGFTRTTGSWFLTCHDCLSDPAYLAHRRKEDNSTIRRKEKEKEAAEA